jgi:hypothetical protein
MMQLRHGIEEMGNELGAMLDGSCCNLGACNAKKGHV